MCHTKATMLFCKSYRAVVCYTAVWKERCVTTLKLSRHATPLPIQETAQPWVLVSKETFVWEAMRHARQSSILLLKKGIF